MALTLLLGLGATVAQADYRDLLAAFEQYRPPSHLLRPAAQAPSQSPAENDAFEAEKQRLANLKASWQEEIQDLAAPTAGGGYDGDGDGDDDGDDGDDDDDDDDDGDDDDDDVDGDDDDDDDVVVR